MADKSELRIQQECYIWLNNEYPYLRGLFFKITNENKNRISGAIGKATGVVPGVADTCLLVPFKNAHFIEFKTPKGKQSLNQKLWEKTIKAIDYNYSIIRTVEEFQTLIRTII